MKKFIELVRRLESEDLLIDVTGPANDVVVEGLSRDSRLVQSGSLFTAIRGSGADGHVFIDKAVENGASALVFEAAPGGELPGVACARVTDARAAWSVLNSAFHGDPSQELDLIGVTGTNGKTTVSHLVYQALNQLGRPSGLIGTIQVDDGRRMSSATLTTPDSADINELLARMVANDCRACSMEVSSHGLDQERTAGLSFRAGIFTNLTRDHLDYHTSFDAYLASKRKLFERLDAGSSAVANADDPSHAAVTEATKSDLVTYGTSKDAHIRFAIRDEGIEGLTLNLDGAEFNCRLLGAFNAYNVAAAYACLTALGCSAGQVRQVLAEVRPVPGRFEKVRPGGPGLIVVDYAHTPDALDNALRALRSMRASCGPATGQIWCVFGCGGDRDREKRSEMGRIAEAGADRVVVTSDNPRSEDPLDIMAAIREGMQWPSRAEWIPDRRHAIRKVAELADPADFVLIAGKGHETYQDIGGVRREFDDRVVAREYFGIPDRGPALETPTH
jgi:UDP-N-acetylmuramoyl-L-alanyl-D-glutamate--2,6-diaminopimelate ligase